MTRHWCIPPCVLPAGHFLGCWDGSYPLVPDGPKPAECECETWMLREGTIAAGCPFHDRSDDG